MKPMKTTITLKNELNKFFALSIGFALVCGNLVFNGFSAQSAADKEAALIAVLKSDAGQKEKADACRELAVYGSKAAVPTLAALLTDEKLSHMARYALEPINDPSVDDALRDALGKVKGRLLVGVIGSIGVRRDAKAVDALTGFLNDQDPDVAQAAARALGSIGNVQCVKALRNALEKAPAANILSICEGLFRCAESLTASGQTKEAMSVYDYLRNYKQAPHQVKTGSIRGAILTRDEKDGLALLRECLNSADYLTFSAAVRTALEMKGDAVGKVLASEVKNLKPDNQIVVINAIAHRVDKSAVDAVIDLTKSENKPVKIAALKALGSLGDERGLPVLTGLVDFQDEEIARVVRDVLAGFAGKSADAAVLKLLSDEKPARKLIGIDLVARRKIQGAATELIKLASDPDQQVRQQALRRVGELGEVSDIASLLEIAKKSQNQQELNAIAQSLSVICSRASDQNAAISGVIKFMATATPVQKSAMMQVFSAVGNQTALNAVLEAAKDTNRQVRESAIRALGDWKSPEPASALINLAKSTNDKQERSLCLRSFFNLARQTEIPAEQRLDLCKQASTMLETAEEKKLLLSAVSAINSDQVFDLVVPMLSDASVSEEAGATIVNVATRLLQPRRAVASQKTIDALQKTTSANVSENVKKQANALLQKAKSPAGNK